MLQYNDPFRVPFQRDCTIGNNRIRQVVMIFKLRCSKTPKTPAGEGRDQKEKAFCGKKKDETVSLRVRIGSSPLQDHTRKRVKRLARKRPLTATKKPDSSSFRRARLTRFKLSL